MPRPPVPPQKITFEGWLEDLFKMPSNLSQQTFAVLKKGYNSYYVMRVNAFATTGSKEPDLVALYTEGPESLQDVQGVHTSIELRDFLEKAPGSIYAFGESFVKQVLDVEDISSQRRAHHIDQLARGKVKDSEDRDLDTPSNILIDKGIPESVLPYKKGYPISVIAGEKKSDIELLKPKAKDSTEYDDRYAIEENKNINTKPYQDLARNLSHLALNINTRDYRDEGFSGSLKDFNQIVLTELGINLDQALMSKKSKGKLLSAIVGVNGEGGEIEFIEKMHRHNFNYEKNTADLIKSGKVGNVTQIINNDEIVAWIAGMNPTQFNQLSTGTQELIRKSIIAGELNIRASMWDVFAQPGSQMIEAWSKAGLDDSILGKYYKDKGIPGKVGFQTSLSRGDILHLSQQKNLENWMYIDGHLEEIRSDMLNRLTIEIENQKKIAIKNGISNFMEDEPTASNDELLAYKQEMEEYYEEHYANIYEQRKGRALDRLTAAENSMDIANNLYFTGVTRDILDAVKDGKLMQLAMVNSRFLGLNPFAPRELRAPAELISFAMPENLPVVREYARFFREEIIPRTGIQFSESQLIQRELDIEALKQRKEDIEKLKRELLSTTDLAEKAKIQDKLNKLTKLDLSTRVKNSFAITADKLSFLDGRNIPGPWKDAWAPVQWRVGTGDNYKYEFRFVKAKETEGIFGANVKKSMKFDPKVGFSVNGKLKEVSGYGVMDFLSEINELDVGKLNVLSGHFGGNLLDPASLINGDLSEFGTLQKFAGSLLDLDLLNSTDPSLYGLRELAIELKLIEEMDGVWVYTTKGAEFKQMMGKFDKKGRFFLEDKFRAWGIDPSQRWEVLKQLEKFGSLRNFAYNTTGILTNINRYQNYVKDYFYKNIIWAKDLNLPIFGRRFNPIMSRIQRLFNRFGLSDEMGLTQAINNWKFIDRTRKLGSAFKTMNFTGMRGAGFLTRLGNLKIFGRAFGQFFMRSMGFLISGISGIMTAGIGFIVAGFQSAITAFLKSTLLHGDISGGINAAKEELKQTFWTFKKIILYTCFSLATCCIVPLILLMLILMTLLAPFKRLAADFRTIFPPSVASELIKVTKTAKYFNTDKKINYLINIQNITPTLRGVSMDPEIKTNVAIKSLTDNLFYYPGCEDPNKGKIIQYGEPNFIGTVDGATNNKELSTMLFGFISPPIIKSEHAVELSFDLKNTTDKDSTYVNRIEIKAVGEEGKSAIDTAIINIGKGGCMKCPSGWPLQSPFYESQGPGGQPTHRNGVVAIEAVDFAANSGTPVYATINGQVVRTGNKEFCMSPRSSGVGSILAYGCFLEIQPLDDSSYSIIYAHMQSVDLSVNNIVSAGEIIGKVGSTGYSSGNHLHYEFKRKPQCIPGFPLELKNVQGDSYLPQTVQRNCGDRTLGPGCNFVVN